MVTAPTLVTATEGQQLQLTITASDPNGNPITSFVADLTQLPVGNASFAPGSANASGTFTWTPSSDDGRPTEYLITFTAANALSSTASTRILVPGNRAPFVTRARQPHGQVGEPVSFDVTASDPDGASSLVPGRSHELFRRDTTRSSRRQVHGTFSWTPGPNDVRPNPYP